MTWVLIKPISQVSGTFLPALFPGWTIKTVLLPTIITEDEIHTTTCNDWWAIQNTHKTVQTFLEIVYDNVLVVPNSYSGSFTKGWKVKWTVMLQLPCTCVYFLFCVRVVGTMATKMNTKWLNSLIIPTSKEYI